MAKQQNRNIMRPFLATAGEAPADPLGGATKAQRKASTGISSQERREHAAAFPPLEQAGFRGPFQWRQQRESERQAVIRNDPEVTTPGRGYSAAHIPAAWSATPRAALLSKWTRLRGAGVSSSAPRTAGHVEPPKPCARYGVVQDVWGQVLKEL